MKSLNRAIARTVSQIARYAGEGCHVPMIMALENHLCALLAMERKMLEGVQELAEPEPNYSWFTPEQGMTYGSWYEEEEEPPAPDVIDMTDPRNWQVGDVVRRKCVGVRFIKGREYSVHSNDNSSVHIEAQQGYGVSYPHGTTFDGAEHYFTWLRHGEVQS